MPLLTLWSPFPACTAKSPQLPFLPVTATLEPALRGNFLEDVLKALPDNLHPQSVSGFFLTPLADLGRNGEAVSAKAWLESGGDVAPVLDLAQSLASGY